MQVQPLHKFLQGQQCTRKGFRKPSRYMHTYASPPPGGGGLKTHRRKKEAAQNPRKIYASPAWKNPAAARAGPEK